jgi:hypothetical protein
LLYFELKRQQLVELIKAGQVSEAISFSQNKMAGLVNNDSFRIELEKTMALLILEDPTKSPLKELVDNSSRQRLASQVNQAIL